MGTEESDRWNRRENSKTGVHIYIWGHTYGDLLHDSAVTTPWRKHIHTVDDVGETSSLHGEKRTINLYILPRINVCSKWMNKLNVNYDIKKKIFLMWENIFVT